MKKTAILLICISSFILTSAQIQPTSSAGTYKNLFKVSAAMFTRNTFQMGFEHMFSPTGSFQINAGMNFRDSDYEQSWGIGTEAQVKFYVYNLIQPKNSHRLYFAPYLTNNYQEVKQQQWDNLGYSYWNDDTFDAVGTGILFGWSFSFANRINLDIYTGGGIRKSFNVDGYYDNTVWDYSYSGISPRLGIDVGFWF